MRKKNKKGRIFSRPKNQRVALLNSLATSLFERGKITTTEAKAKDLKMTAEKLITRARDNTVANRKLLVKYLPPAVARKLATEIAPQYASRSGGYTRITKLGPRKSDGAAMAIIELVK